VYDATNRPAILIDSEGYAITNLYDNLDRLVRRSFPDGTSEQTNYGNILDAVQTVDRLGRTNSLVYDGNRRLLTITNAASQVTRFGWCNCGAVGTLTDPKGNVTTWERDLQGRVTNKVYAAGAPVAYAYRTDNGLLDSILDGNGQITQYNYNLDGSLQQVVYTNAVIATPSVSFAYDPNYRRVTQMIDGTGTNTYGYYPVNGTIGAGRLATNTVTGLVSAQIVYGYDALGRATRRAISGSKSGILRHIEEAWEREGGVQSCASHP
jgi:YD repeat-containing protein